MVKNMTLTVWKWITIVTLFGSSFSIPTLSIAQECGSDVNPCERPRTGVFIRSVKTSGMGHMAPGFSHSEHPCSEFKLTASQVRHYLRSAGRITQNDMQYVVDESACVVTGVVQFSNGKSHRFAIGELRDGKIYGPGNAIEYLYCGACLAPPFFE